MPRPGETYRAARRNQAREIRKVLKDKNHKVRWSEIFDKTLKFYNGVAKGV